MDCNSIKSSALVYHGNFDLTWSTVSLPFACASAARVCACDALLDVVSLAFNARTLSRPPALSNTVSIVLRQSEAPGKVLFAFQEGVLLNIGFHFPFTCFRLFRKRVYILCVANCSAPQEGMDVLPVVIESVPLRQLGVEVYEMAGKKEIVLRSNC